jgi:hypothetical protein
MSRGKESVHALCVIYKLSMGNDPAYVLKVTMIFA